MTDESIRAKQRLAAGRRLLGAEMPISLYEEFAAAAHDQGFTLRDEIEWALRTWLALPDAQRQKYRVSYRKAVKSHKRATAE